MIPYLVDVNYFLSSHCWLEANLNISDDDAVYNRKILHYFMSNGEFYKIKRLKIIRNFLKMSLFGLFLLNTLSKVKFY